MMLMMLMMPPFQPCEMRNCLGSWCTKRLELRGFVTDRERTRKGSLAELR